VNRDLVILVADKDIEQAMRGILHRPEALGLRSIHFELIVDPNHDPGCYSRADQLLQPYAGRFDHALVLFDSAWEGAPSRDPDVLAKKVEEDLRDDWGDRARCVVIAPEVETWIWSDSPHVAEILGWASRDPPLRSWLEQQSFWPASHDKPLDPKGAYLAVLHEVRLPPSSDNFLKLARRVSFRRCTDRSFTALVGILVLWFPTRAR
jgi:hypothetical protein